MSSRDYQIGGCGFKSCPGQNMYVYKLCLIRDQLASIIDVVEIHIARGGSDNLFGKVGKNSYFIICICSV